MTLCRLLPKGEVAGYLEIAVAWLVPIAQEAILETICSALSDDAVAKILARMDAEEPPGKDGRTS
jgi:hypothetical protein